MYQYSNNSSAEAFRTNFYTGGVLFVSKYVFGIQGKNRKLTNFPLSSKSFGVMLIY